MRRIYMASSWRNEFYNNTLQLLLRNDFLVHDWRDPSTAFKWSQANMPTDPTAEEQRQILIGNARCSQGFLADFRGMQWANTCILLLPSGRSAHLEAGWCKGAGKHCVVYLRDGEEPDLMNLLFDDLITSDQELLNVLHGTSYRQVA